jgi:hypothetical protein
VIGNGRFHNFHFSENLDSLEEMEIMQDEKRRILMELYSELEDHILNIIQDINPLYPMLQPI